MVGMWNFFCLSLNKNKFHGWWVGVSRKKLRARVLATRNMGVNRSKPDPAAPADRRAVSLYPPPVFMFTPRSDTLQYSQAGRSRRRSHRDRLDCRRAF